MVSVAPSQPAHPARVVHLGLRSYDEVWRIQLEMVAARQRDEIPDTIILVEHPDVLTMGRGTRRENLLNADDMPIFEIERGGDVTYHGPGQLVGYPIFRLREGERDLHAYLRNLEEALINTCADLGLQTTRRPSLTGVWTNTEPARKLASIGIAVKKWVTLHGFAFNVATNLSRFAAINPCGLDANVMTSLSEALGRPLTLGDVTPVVLRHLATALNRDLVFTQ